MKRIIMLIIIMIGIPYLITLIFIKKDDQIKFYFTSNTVVRVKRQATGKIDEVPLEEYVVGVLAGEMPVSFELEALKAQAVAARTYVIKRIVDNKNKEYDVVDTPLNQAYIDSETLKNKWQKKYDEYINKLKIAVLQTRGEYLTYNNKIIDALFFSTSVGQTENSEDVFPNTIPYLRSVDSSWDEKVSPVFSETSEMSLEEFYKLLGLNYSEKLNIEVINTTSTGRIKKIKINGKEFTGSEVANKLKVRSNYFDILKTGNIIDITTKGYGHGVGMSQYGAQAMALNGSKYDYILKYYYQDIEIKKI